MKIDWLEKLSYFLQTLAFCLAVAAIQYAFQPQRPYVVPLVYSLCIGTSMWAMIDFGRHLFPSAAATGWPQGKWRLGLPVASIVGAYGVGTLAGDSLFGWSSWDANAAARSQLSVSLLVTALAGVVASGYFYSRNKAAWLEATTSEAKRHASEAKLKLLETQIEPHMLFNTLANLRALISADPTRAQTMLDHLISYLRATLSASRANTHPLQTEFDRLQDYLELMAVRMGPRLRYTLTLPAALASQQVPPLLLQPLVENAIKHGLEPSVAGGEIAVQAQAANGQLILTVQDTGVGLSARPDDRRSGQTGPVNMPSGTPGSTGGGFGLAQVRERLHTLYGVAASFELAPALADSVNGTAARIHLPLN